MHDTLASFEFLLGNLVMLALLAVLSGACYLLARLARFVHSLFDRRS